MTQSIEREHPAGINGHTVRGELLALPEPVQHDVEPDDEDLAADLNEQRREAAARVAVQDDEVLRNVKDADELEKDWESARKHRTALRGEQDARNRAEIRGLRRARKTDEQIARLDQRDQLDARKATATRTRLTSPASHLARLHRGRSLSMLCVSLPALVGVVLGAGNVQGELVQLMQWGPSNPMYWASIGFEPLATLPLVGILVYQAFLGGRGWSHKSDDGFGGTKSLLLALAVAANSGLHVVNGEYKQAAVWLFVPLLIAVTLTLLPKVADGFARALVEARTEAALSAPVGNLDGDTAKLLRAVRYVQELDKQGQVGGERDEHGVPSATKITNALHGQQGRVGKDVGRRVKAAWLVLQGGDQQEQDTADTE